MPTRTGSRAVRHAGSLMAALALAAACRPCRGGGASGGAVFATPSLRVAIAAAGNLASVTLRTGSSGAGTSHVMWPPHGAGSGAAPVVQFMEVGPTTADGMPSQTGSKTTATLGTAACWLPPLELRSVSQPGGSNTPMKAVFRPPPTCTGFGSGAVVEATIQANLTGQTLFFQVPKGGLAVHGVAAPGWARPGSRGHCTLSFVRLQVVADGAAPHLAAAYTNSTDAGLALALVPVDLPVGVTAAHVPGPDRTETPAPLVSLQAGLPLLLQPAVNGSGPALGPLYAGEGGRVALWGGPRDLLAAAVHGIEVAYGLPDPRIGGVPAKKSAAAKEGYFLTNVD